MSILLGIACIILFSYPGNARRLPFRIYSQKNGLAAATVNSIYQDSRGYLWFGTSNGLSCFDGVDFKNLRKENGLPANWINALHEDMRGNLWIGTDTRGTACLKDGLYTNYSIEDGLAGKRVFCITEDENGRLWFAGVEGLSCFDGKQFTNFTESDGLPDNYVLSLVFDKTGKLWIGTTGGLVYYDGRKLIRPPAPADFAGYKVFSLKPVETGMWVGTGRGLFFMKKSGTFKVSAIKDAGKSIVRAILVDTEGNTWFGTDSGLVLLSEGKYSTFNTADGLKHQSIRAIFQDSEGNLWFGTGNGIARLSRFNVWMYNEKDEFPGKKVFKLMQDSRNRIWVGTTLGIFRFSNGQFKQFTESNGLGNNEIQHIADGPRGNIWITTATGLSILNPESLRFTNYKYDDGLPGRYIYCSHPNPDGTGWIGGPDGIRLLKNGKILPPPFPDSGLGKVTVIIIDDKSNLWFTSWNTLKCYQPGSGVLKTYGFTEGIPGGTVRDIFQDGSGRMWVAAADGLACLEKGKNVFKIYSTRDGLPDNLCYFVCEDHTGALWIGTAEGLARYDGKHFKILSIPELDLTAGSWYCGIRDTHNNLWLGSNEGLVQMTPPFFKLNRIPPPIYFTGLKVLEKDYPVTDYREPIRLDYEENHLRIYFTGLCYTEPENVGYRYRLDNLDKYWHETSSRSVFYPYLPPGEYRFQVKALNNDGVESLEVAEFPLIIEPPFWQTLWFQSMVILLVSGAIVFFLQWRLKRDREKEELKSQKRELEANRRQLVMSQRMELMGTLATGTVHDLKNLLSIILGYSNLVKSKVSADDKSLKYIETIKDTAETATQMAAQILSFSRLRSGTPNNADLGIWMSEILKTLKVSIPKNIRTLWTQPNVPILFPIHSSHFQQVVMNLCLNAAQAMPLGGDLAIHLEKQETGDIVLQVSDSGTGMDRETLERIFEPLYTTKEEGEGTGLGLFVVKQIVEEHGGTIDVVSRDPEGTTFTIIFKVK